MKITIDSMFDIGDIVQDMRNYMSTESKQGIIKGISVQENGDITYFLYQVEFLNDVRWMLAEDIALDSICNKEENK